MFKEAGNWWNDRSIELIEKNGKVYALHGWNGEKYAACWECKGKYLTEASKEKYTITPIYDDQLEEIIDYEID